MKWIFNIIHFNQLDESLYVLVADYSGEYLTFTSVLLPRLFATILEDNSIIHKLLL